MCYHMSMHHLMACILSSPCRFATFLARSTPSSPTLKIRVCGTFQFQPLRLVTRTGTTRFESSTMSKESSESETPKPQNDGAGDVVVQYVVLRRDLIDTWPMGSVVTQGCHASVAAVWANKDDPHTIQYCGPENIDSMHKVTLEVKGEAQMVNLSEKLKAGGIAHKLWIEHPENIPTCLATKPYPKAEVASFFKKLKLCK